MFVTRRTFDKFMAALTLPEDEVVAPEDVLERLKQKAIPVAILRCILQDEPPGAVSF